MNKQRRIELEDVVLELENASFRISDIIEQERESYEALPSGLQNSVTGEKMEVTIDKMEHIITEIGKVTMLILDITQPKKH